MGFTGIKHIRSIILLLCLSVTWAGLEFWSLRPPKYWITGGTATAPASFSFLILIWTYPPSSRPSQAHETKRKRLGANWFFPPRAPFHFIWGARKGSKRLSTERRQLKTCDAAAHVYPGQDSGWPEQEGLLTPGPAHALPERPAATP